MKLELVIYLEKGVADRCHLLHAYLLARAEKS